MLEELPREPKKGNLIFLHTRGTRSEVIAPILFRFGAHHGLRFAISGTQGESTVDLESIDRQGMPFNVLCQPLSSPPPPFRKMPEEFGKVVPNGFLLGILREPVAQKLALFQTSPAIKNPPSDEFEKMAKIDSSGNPTCQSLGIEGEKDLEEILASPQWSNQVFFLIFEHLEESLVLLRRKLKWDLYDVLLIPPSFDCIDPTGRHVSCGDDAFVSAVLSSETLEALREKSSLDQKLYDHYLQIHRQTVAEQDESFFQEVVQLRNGMEWLRNHCQEELRYHQNNGKTYRETWVTYCYKYVIEETYWGEVIRKSGYPWLASRHVESVAPLVDGRADIFSEGQEEEAHGRDDLFSEGQEEQKG